MPLPETVGIIEDLSVHHLFIVVLLLLHKAVITA